MAAVNSLTTFARIKTNTYQLMTNKKSDATSDKFENKKSSSSAAPRKYNYQIIRKGGCVKHFRACTTHFDKLNDVTAGSLIYKDEMNSLIGVANTVYQSFSRLGSDVKQGSISIYYKPKSNSSNKSRQFDAAHDTLNISDLRGPYYLAKDIDSSSVTPSSTNVLTAKFMNDIADNIYNHSRECMCNSDCQCNAVCACNNDCQCNYT